jgi:hypothetical protein
VGPALVVWAILVGSVVFNRCSGRAVATVEVAGSKGSIIKRLVEDSSKWSKALPRLVDLFPNNVVNATKKLSIDVGARAGRVADAASSLAEASTKAYKATHAATINLTSQVASLAGGAPASSTDNTVEFVDDAYEPVPAQAHEERPPAPSEAPSASPPPSPPAATWPPTAQEQDAAACAPALSPQMLAAATNDVIPIGEMSSALAGVRSERRPFSPTSASASIPQAWSAKRDSLWANLATSLRPRRMS